MTPPENARRTSFLDRITELDERTQFLFGAMCGWIAGTFFSAVVLIVVTAVRG